MTQYCLGDIINSVEETIKQVDTVFTSSTILPPIHIYDALKSIPSEIDDITNAKNKMDYPKHIQKPTPEDEKKDRERIDKLIGKYATIPYRADDVDCEPLDKSVEE